MAEIVVVGAGLGGLAVAARLAKQRHRVTVLERASEPGGAFGRIERAGFGWDAGPTSTALPAVLRDLFRKSGRPLERYVELEHRGVARRHVFADGAVVDLPTGSRGAQIDAVDAGLGAGCGERWAEFVDAQAAVWAVLRKEILDDPLGGSRLSDRRIAKQLGFRVSLEKLLKNTFADDRMRQMVAQPFKLMGSHPRDVPSTAAVQHYVERSFGLWQARGGMAAVMDALVGRMAERGVDVRCDSEVTSIEVDAGRVRAVAVANGDRVPADVVVTDLDARTVLTRLLPDGIADDAARAFATATPALPPAVTHLGLDAAGRDDLPAEIVVHGDPLMVVVTTGEAPAGQQAWTVLQRGGSGEDVLSGLARRGYDVRAQVVTRVDRSAADIVAETAGSPYGPAFDGWRAAARRARYTEPVAGLFLVGSSVHPGPGIPYVGWGAAHVAQLVHESVVSPTRT